MKHIYKSDIDAIRRNVLWFVVYAAALAIVMFDLFVWRP
jgi:hypothetical protein